MISTRHLHPHAAKTAAAPLQPDCCTAVARPLHDFHLAIAPLLHDFCPAIAPLLQGSGRPSAHALPPTPFRSCPGTETMPQIPNPHATRTTKGRQNRAIARWAGLGWAGSGRTETDQLRANQPKPNLPELN